MSGVIGYPLVVISLNEASWWSINFTQIKRYAILMGLFAVIGLIGTEIQAFADHHLFNQPGYKPFHAGGTYFFNAILTCIIGGMTLRWAEAAAPKAAPVPLTEQDKSTLTKIPLKKGDTVTLKPLEEVTYFEAYDNYSFLHDVGGQRSLCNYSLAHLETRLDVRFLRVHRKYLINTDMVASIAPHLKGRFLITFIDAEKSSLISSAGFSDEVKALLKI